MKINIFWFRNDLRLEDNTALQHALSEEIPVLPVYIFDTNILEELAENDPGISFIYDTLNQINKDLHKSGSSVLVDETAQTMEKALASKDRQAAGMVTLRRKRA